MSGKNDWKKEIEEISNGQYSLTLVHYLGPKIVLTGADLEKLEIEAKETQNKMDLEIAKKIEDRKSQAKQ